MAVIAGRIGYINRAGLALLGFARPEDVLGKTIEAIVDARAVHALLIGRQERGEFDKGNWLRPSLNCAAGSTVDVELLMAPMAGRDAIAHAHKISNGGPPTVLIGDEEVVTF